MNPPEQAGPTGSSDNPPERTMPPPPAAGVGAGLRNKARSFTAPLTRAAESVTGSMPTPNLYPRGRSIPQDRAFPPASSAELGGNPPFRRLSQVPEMAVPSPRGMDNIHPGIAPSSQDATQGSSLPPHRYSVPENMHFATRTADGPLNFPKPPAPENNAPVPPEQAVPPPGGPPGAPHPYETQRQPSQDAGPPDFPYPHPMQPQHPLFSLDPFRPVTPQFPQQGPPPPPKPDAQVPESEQKPESGEFLDHVANKIFEKLRGLSVSDTHESGAPNMLSTPSSFPSPGRKPSVPGPMLHGVEGIFMPPSNFPADRAQSQDITGSLPFETQRHMSQGPDAMRQSMDPSHGFNPTEISNGMMDKQSLEVAWGKLFTESGRPMMRLSHLLRGLALYMTENYPPENSVVMTPAKMTRFYAETKPELEKHNWDEIFDENNSENLGRLYRALGVEYHLVQSSQDKTPALPALTPKGFDQWMTLMIQAYPDHEYQRIRNAVMLMPISNPEDRAQKFPRDIPRRCFPLRKDMAIHSTVKHGLKECVIREPSNMMPRPSISLPHVQGPDPSMSAMHPMQGLQNQPQTLLKEQENAAIASEEALAAAAHQEAPLVLERQRKPYSAVPSIIDVMRKDPSPPHYANPRVSEAPTDDLVSPSLDTAASLYGDELHVGSSRKPRVRSPSRSSTTERPRHIDFEEPERYASPPKSQRPPARGRERLASVETGMPAAPTPYYTQRVDEEDDYDLGPQDRRSRRGSVARGRSMTRRSSVGRDLSQEAPDHMARGRSRGRYESAGPYDDYYDYDARSDPYRQPNYRSTPASGRATPAEYERVKSPYPPRQPPYDNSMPGPGHYPPPPGYESGYGPSQAPNPYYPPTSQAGGGYYNPNGSYDGYMNDGMGMDPYYGNYYQPQGQYGADAGYQAGGYPQAGGMGDPYSAYYQQQQQQGYGYGSAAPETTMPPASSAPGMYQQNPYGMAPPTMGADPYSGAAQGGMPNGAETRPPPPPPAAAMADPRAQYGGAPGDYTAAPVPPPQNPQAAAPQAW